MTCFNGFELYLFPDWSLKLVYEFCHCPFLIYLRRVYFIFEDITLENDILSAFYLASDC